MDRRSFMFAAPALVASGCVAVGGAAGPPAPAPTVRVGDKWVYNCSDGFRVPVTWVETHEVTIIDHTGIAVRVTLVGPTMNYERVELWSAPGVVVIGAVFDPAETRNFEPPLIRYQFPLTPGASWNQRLRNLDPANQLMSNISRFVQVGGYTTASTPAGTFDAIEMRTIMSVDDNNPFRLPYECNYVTWWAPEAGNMVRETKFATYRERGNALDAVTIRAQNTTIELASFSRGK
ncbi:MAG: hypothetical protein IT522_07965 [Burkholderiales bacterium]|nr:hypothetical protein [Burkholderiales bacterium]